jgi:hypothetical protein
MSVARVGLDLAVSILQVHGVNSASQTAPQPTLGLQPLPWVLFSRCQRSSRRSLRASRVNEIAKHFAKFVRG